jgi:hypothetical protein
MVLIAAARRLPGAALEAVIEALAAEMGARPGDVDRGGDEGF